MFVLHYSATGQVEGVLVSGMYGSALQFDGVTQWLSVGEYSDIVNSYKNVKQFNNRRPRSLEKQGDNALGSVRLSVCPSSLLSQLIFRLLVCALPAIPVEPCDLRPSSFVLGSTLTFARLVM